ncbi:hypothetical protein [Endozoicomonas ascidiicola]|uniref:hypothetical protein n=1 Tax=Endozoicomonas ascidiicola TaxID=1698521 RepID=UPI0012F88D53|nr:hypothetical protein [Endozoicomonas ascidiicola]
MLDPLSNVTFQGVTLFRLSTLKNKCQYRGRYKGEYLYLEKSDFSGFTKTCRLKYNGANDNWDFAIFKYSSERYAPEEMFFPGDECLDGTVEGALKAGLRAYP